jgi:uncharacterized protein (TIGR02466 family)
MNNNIDILRPFGPEIFKLHFNFDFEKLKPICQDLIDNAPEGPGLVVNGKTSHQNHVQPHKIPEFKEYFSWLMPIVKEVAMNAMGYSKFFHKYYLGNSWVNVHNEKGETFIHNHPNTFLVATAYLNMPKNGGYFECKDPLEYHKSSLPTSNMHYWKELPCVSGDVLIFPGWLQHKTQVNLSNEERWVLTTNFLQEYTV